MMKTITLKINDSTKKGKAFLEFARTFFEEGKEVKLIESTSTDFSKEEISFLKKLESTKKEMQDLSAGKKKGQTLQSFLDEL